MNPYQRAAAMAMMETHDPVGTINIVGAMVNRARHDKADLGTQVGSRIYQPSFEPAQEKRLSDIIKNPHFYALADVAEKYWTGERPVPHSATHYLAPESTMLALEKQDPDKYKSWRSWTGYDDSTGSYKNVAFRDNSHAFLTPDAPAATNQPPSGMTPVPKSTTPVDYDPFDADTAKLLAMIQPQKQSQTVSVPAKPKFDSQGNYLISNDIALPNVKLTSIEHDPWNNLIPVEHNPFETLK
jgi:hypothetical protein